MDEDDTDVNIDTYLVESPFVALKRVLKAKHERLKKEILKTGINIHRYDQLAQEIKANDVDDAEQLVSPDKIFHVGYEFIYCDHEKEQQRLLYMQNQQNDCLVYVIPTYLSFKEEVTKNKIIVLNIDQWNSEYNKAQKHFASAYRKNSYPYIGMEHLLVLMIYCNYTELQYQFSKTYREVNGKKHTLFFWMGKFLKQAVSEFGTAIALSLIRKFYHGVSVLLQFSNEIQIHCPLSTTTSFEVAANFASQKNGMIVEFKEYPEMMHSYSKKFFSVAWLSDYAAEKEHLFIQSEQITKWRVEGITEFRSGHTYLIIFQTLDHIDQLMGGNTIFWEPDDHSNKLEEGMKLLIAAIVSNQLYQKLKDFQKFESLSDYGRDKCNLHFLMKDELRITLGSRQDSPRSINIKHILLLYPNLKHIEILNMDLNQLKQLINDWKQVMHVTELRRITIDMDNTQKVDRNWCITLTDEYSKFCLETGLFIMAHFKYGENKVVICKCFENETMIRLLDGIGQLYFKHIDPQMMQQMNNLIQSKMLNSYTTQEEKEFAAVCEGKMEWQFEWEELKLNSVLFPFLCNFKLKWIDLKRVNEFFPNLEKIVSTQPLESVAGIKSIVNEIWDHLQQQRTKFVTISLIFTYGKVDSFASDVKMLVDIYENKFNNIGFSVVLNSDSENTFHCIAIKSVTNL